MSSGTFLTPLFQSSGFCLCTARMINDGTIKCRLNESG